MRMFSFIIIGVLLCFGSCSKKKNVVIQNPSYTVSSFDGVATGSFGSLPYRVYYPKELTTQTYVIHVSRGGTGAGDDRGQLLPYINDYVQKGYVVVQIDHRPVAVTVTSTDFKPLAQSRGQEINFIAGKVASGTLSYGGFSGTIDGSKQGYIGHSGGCMEGMEAVGTTVTHGNYFVPQIKAIYGMSPVGFTPDQFGITSGGFGGIDKPAVFVILGEEEKDVNGFGTFMATDWRLQAYLSMNTNAPRYQAYVKGMHTTHNDIPTDNVDIQNFNVSNSTAFFDNYIRGIDRKSEIGILSLPPNNTVVLTKKGL